MWKQILAAILLVVAGAWAQDDSIKRGITQYKTGDFAGAIVTFQSILDRDPKNATALQGIAYSNFQAAGASHDPIYKNKMLDEAARCYHRSIEVNPQAAYAYYSLGVIAWTRVYPELQSARTQSGMQRQDPGPIKDPGLRQKLQALYAPVIDGGIQNLEKALEIISNYSDAMAYMNLLLRSRSDIRDTAEQASEDSHAADGWVEKAMQAKKTELVSESVWNLTPPPPLPPPPGAIRVGGDVQAANLLVNVNPVYPPLAKQAQIQGAVKFNVVIGKDGRMTNMTLVSGHPLLVAAAQTAMQQWVYRPTLLNGEPVPVVTTAQVNFTLNQ